jgi:hypothetical protein
MNRYRKFWPSLTLVVAVVLSVCGAAVAEDVPAEASGQAQTSSSNAAAASSATPDKDWHIAATSYLWFAGLSGTVGVRGFDTSVHASAADVLSHFNIGLMEFVEARKNRFVVPVDFMWIKLSDDKSLPRFPNYSVKAKVTETLLAPKVGYVLVDQEKVKASGTVGIRYWHLGTTLQLQPQIAGANLYQSANWVDVVGGAKIDVPLSPKASVTIFGDAGAGGANLDYQLGAALNYRIKPKWVLLGGWRYLDVDYRGNNQFLFDAHMSGLVLGVTYVFK